MTQQQFLRICLWMGPVTLLLFFGAFLAGGFLPPPAPSWSPERIGEHYRDHITGIRICAALLVLAGGTYVAYVGSLTGVLRRIPGLAPGVRYTVLGAGALACTTLITPGLAFAAASYRPEQGDLVTQQLNDTAWMFTIMPFPPFMTMYFAFAFAILCDKRPQPLLPRWLGWMNFAAPFVYSSALFIPFVKDGVLAWNGLITFWVAAAVFGPHHIANFVMVRRTLSDDAEDPASTAPDDAGAEQQAVAR